MKLRYSWLPPTIASLPKPGGNLTGFSGTEFSVGGKWNARPDRQVCDLLAVPSANLRLTSPVVRRQSFAVISQCKRSLVAHCSP